MQYDHKYCPICKKDLIIGEEGGLERKRCSDEECNFVLWNNPIPVLAAIAHRNDEVILVQSIGWPSHWYSLVTGFMEANESPKEGIAREVKEEIGLDSEVGKLIGVYDFQKKSSIVKCSRDSIKEIAETASTLAREEGLTAHARSAEFRLNSE